MAILDRALSANEPVAILVQEGGVLVTGATVVCDVIDFATNTVLNTLSLTETPSSSGYYKAAADVVPAAAPYNAVLGSVHLYRFRETAPVVRTLLEVGVAYRTLETSAEAVAALPANVVNQSVMAAPAGSLGYNALIARKMLKNKKWIVGQNLVIYDDDGVTVLFTIPLHDVNGAAIAPATGEPAQFG